MEKLNAADLAVFVDVLQYSLRFRDYPGLFSEESRRQALNHALRILEQTTVATECSDEQL